LQKDRIEYKYDQTSNRWIQKDEFMDKVLEKGVLVRYKITSLKYLNNDFVSECCLTVCRA
jgi:DNA-directed RNA polymerase subunit E'/Rpb7